MNIWNCAEENEAWRELSLIVLLIFWNGEENWLCSVREKWPRGRSISLVKWYSIDPLFSEKEKLRLREEEAWQFRSSLQAATNYSEKSYLGIALKLTSDWRAPLEDWLAKLKHCEKALMKIHSAITAVTSKYHVKRKAWYFPEEEREGYNTDTFVLTFPVHLRGTGWHAILQWEADCSEEEEEVRLERYSVHGVGHSPEVGGVLSHYMFTEPTCCIPGREATFCYSVFCEA